MKNLLILTSIFFCGTFSWSQTINNVTYLGNIFCDGESKTFVVEIDNSASNIYSVNIPTTSNNGNLIITQGSTTTPDSTNGTIEYFSFSATNYIGTISADQFSSGETIVLSLFDQSSLPIPGSNYNVSSFDIYGAVSANIDLTSINICSNGLPFDLSPYGTPTGGEFTWGSEQSNYFNPTDFYEDLNGMTPLVDYSVTNSVGCVGTTTTSFNFKAPPTVSITQINPTNCGSATASVEAVISSSTNPINVFWSTGLEENITNTSYISTVSNLSSGAYYCTVTDADGCKAVGTIKIGDADINVTDAITSETCWGANDGVIDLTVSGGGSVSDVFWSNGITTEDMTGHSGEYFVELHTTNNCNFYNTYVINGPDLNFMLNNVVPYDCINTGSQYINVSVSSSIGIQSIDWRDASNNQVATTATFTPPSPGVYTCTVTDNVGCSKSWDVTLPTNSDIDVNVNKVTKATCGNSDGAIDVDVINLGGGTPTFWQWSNGATTEDLTNVAAGTYTLEFQNSSGCSSFITVDVPNERPYQPQICLLTVDTSLTYNTIIWEKDPNQNIDGFKLYRETTTYSSFELVADIPTSLESVYVDNAASPLDRSWRYFITTYDGCGESYPSYVHKTIHTVANESQVAGTYDIVWDDYEGINYTSVDLWRYTDVNPTWTLVNSFSQGTHSTQDTPTDIIGLNYMVTFNLASTCTSTNKAQDWNSSRSNKTSKTSSFTPGGQTDVSVTEIDNQDGIISIYPNPTNQNLRIYIEKPETYSTIKVLNANGQLISTLKVNSTLTIIDLSSRSEGIYFIQLISDSQVITKKIIKQE